MTTTLSTEQHAGVGLAKALLKIARDDGLESISAEVMRDGHRVHVEIERELLDGLADADGTPDPGPRAALAEQVTVKTGPKNRPRTILAVPAVLVDTASTP